MQEYIEIGSLFVKTSFFVTRNLDHALYFLLSNISNRSDSSSDFHKVQEKPDDESNRFEILLNKEYMKIY